MYDFIKYVLFIFHSFSTSDSQLKEP